MAKRLTQEQKMQKVLEERVTSDVLDEQIEEYLNSGGKIDKIASGESGMKPYSFQRTITSGESTAAPAPKTSK